MDFVTLTVDILKILADFVGNWGVAIIVFTIIVRLLLWPFNVSQQKSMRAMQKLQPKLKLIQERYKNKPEVMQQKLMEFYKDHKFNPMAGCLPLLLQLPIFILLYTALMSQQFISVAGENGFLFVSRLDATIKSNTGVPFDNKFQATSKDRFATDKSATVYLSDGTVLTKVKVKKPMDAIAVDGVFTPGEDINFKFNLDAFDLDFIQKMEVQKAEVNVIDTSTRESEKVTFKRDGNLLSASVPTVKVEESIHYDVIVLVALFIITMWLSTKLMTANNKNAPQDELQEKMQKQMGTMMPIMIGATFIFVPIPAGVLLYLITSNIFQMLQTYIVNKQLDMKDNKAEINENLEAAKVIEAKEIKDTQN